MESDVLYPPAESMRRGKRRNTILGVGGFWTGDADKKHMYLVRAFKKIFEKEAGEWELHMAGNSYKESPYKKCLEAIRKEVEGILFSYMKT